MVVEAGTRGLAMDPNARARRNRRHLGESRAAGQQGQDSSDTKDSTDFHCNAPSS
jgi:DNA-binding sugar fermentation-stimulating protein